MSRRLASVVPRATAPGPDRRLPLALASFLSLAACAAPGRSDATEGEGPPAATAQEPADDAGEAAAPVEAAEDEAPPEEEAAAEGGGGKGGGPKLSGYVSARTRSRWNDEDDEDHNLYAVAAVDLELEGTNPWSFHAMGRGQWQIGGSSDDSVFFGIEDTYDSAVTGRLYYAYADAPSGDVLGLTRLGRQQMVDAPVFLHFDGVRLETPAKGPASMLFGAYGGFPVRLFRDDYTDRLMGGVYTAFAPWVDAQMRLDYTHLVDDPRFGAEDNDLVSVMLRQRLGRDLELDGSYGMLDGQSRDMRLGASWTLPQQQLNLRYTFYNLFKPQTDFVNELDPYFDTLRTWFPFFQNKLTASKLFGEWFEMQLGLDLRRVTDDEDVGRFNRDFDRYFATATLIDRLPFDTSVSLTGEVWDSQQSDINSWGLDLTSRWSEAIRTSIGTFYSLYKTYVDIDEERTNVRTWYAEFRDRLSAPTDILVRYEYEDDELFRYHTLRLGITWKF